MTGGMNVAGVAGAVQRAGAAQTAGAPPERYTLHVVEPANPAASFAAAVRAGLTASPKRLPCRFFYDETGSALFEQICQLPEYYVTRAEREILEEHAGAIAAHVLPGSALVELGSGSAVKTRLLIAALLKRQGALRYVPVDISRSALEESAQQLLARYPGLSITAVAAEYADGLRALAGDAILGAPKPPIPEAPKLILWLGSNIGNLERAEAAGFLRRVRAALGPRDRLLVGVDLRKSRAVLEPAYDDAQGVTARFNKNLLVRINRELGGRFDLDGFDHRAVYDEVSGRIAMYLVSRHAQAVRIDALALDVAFAAGEPVHTEDSYKYSVAEIHDLAAAAGFDVERVWHDAGRRFADVLFRPAPAAA